MKRKHQLLLILVGCLYGIPAMAVLISGESSGHRSVGGGVLAILAYLLFVGLAARRPAHFLVARYLTAIAAAVAVLVIFRPLVLEIRGEFGDMRETVSGIVGLVSIWGLQKAVAARKQIVSRQDPSPTLTEAAR